MDMDINALLAQLETVWGSRGFATIVTLSLVNAALGAAAALQGGEFRLYRVADTFRTMVPFVVAYVAILLMGNQSLEVAVFSTIVTAQTGAIIKNLAALFPTLANVLPNMVLTDAQVAQKAARKA